MSTRQVMLVDLDTGRRVLTGACSRTQHQEWLDQRAAANRRANEVEPAPVPAANTGGVLARHLPEIDWHDLYRRIDPKWMPPPEEQPWQPPTLTLHLGDGADGDDTGPPALSVLTGSGEGINVDGGA